MNLKYCLQISNTDVSVTGGTYQVYNCVSINVRSGPGTDYGVINWAKCGRILTITSQTGNWGYAKEVEGYVRMSYLKNISESTSIDNRIVNTLVNTIQNVSNYSEPLTSGKTYLISPACAPGNLLDVYGAGTANGTNIACYTKHGDVNQRFIAAYIGNGYYAFTPESGRNERKVIDVSGGVVADGTNIQLYDFNGTDAQLFRLYDAGDGYYTISSKLNNSYCIDISNASDASGTNVQLYKRNGTSAQKFKFTEYDSNSHYDPIPTPSQDTSWMWNESGNPVVLNITSDASNRSAERYNAVINQYNVEAHKPGYGYRYSSGRKGSTWCNLYVLDVLAAMGVYPGRCMRCVDLYAWMCEGNSGWYEVSMYEAQQRANAGYPTIAVSASPNHTAMIRPEGNGLYYSQYNCPVISQAGGSNYNYTTLNYGWMRSSFGSIKFFTHA